MALSVKDMMELPSGQKMQLLAGAKGLERPVISVEIADYEFAPGIDFVGGASPELTECLEAGSLIITSFLFAKDDPSLILSSIKKLESLGMTGLAYKRIVFDDLPREVLEFAEEKDFPIFSFDKNVWFENIIFDIMYAVQFDDSEYLSEDKIFKMLEGDMSPAELDIIRKGISLKVQKYVSVVFISGEGFDPDRTLRSFYTQKGLHSKSLMARYESGLFLIITTSKPDFKSHELIRREVFEVTGLSPDWGMSDVHEAKELDKAFRESRFCFMASKAANVNFERFGRTGIYRVLLPALENEETIGFAADTISAFKGNPELWESACEYVSCDGEISLASKKLHCHQNTIRYRLGRIRSLAGLDSATDCEFYLQLKIALAIAKATK